MYHTQRRKKNPSLSIEFLIISMQRILLQGHEEISNSKVFEVKHIYNTPPDLGPVIKFEGPLENLIDEDTHR